MTTYKELLQAREELDRQIAELQKSESRAALDQVRALVAEFELTEQDVFASSKTKKSSTGTKVAPKFKDPATGATWTGRGKPPKWIAGKERSVFAIG